MPSIDDRIKAELERDDSVLADDISDSMGLNDMVWDAYKSGPRRWLWITGILMIVLTGVLVYLIFQFYSANEVLDKVNYGLWILLSTAFLIGLELWSWMQVNRFSTMREIKQMELNIRRLLEKEQGAGKAGEE